MCYFNILVEPLNCLSAIYTFFLIFSLVCLLTRYITLINKVLITIKFYTKHPCLGEKKTYLNLFFEVIFI